ncbi:hypothetical protein STEG23_007041 [Scotinomys teguina]
MQAQARRNPIVKGRDNPSMGETELLKMPTLSDLELILVLISNSMLFIKSGCGKHQGGHIYSTQKPTVAATLTPVADKETKMLRTKIFTG